MVLNSHLVENGISRTLSEKVQLQQMADVMVQLLVSMGSLL
jgi:hypothetical protein